MNKSTREETNLQLRLQKLIRSRGGYIPGKNHGSMITKKGLADLSFSYKGLAVYWEVKTPDTLDTVTEHQGIHCRLAKKSGAITAIISTMQEANYILDLIDQYTKNTTSFYEWYRYHVILNDRGGWNDGTSY